MGVSGRPTLAWASENAPFLTTLPSLQNSPAAKAATTAASMMIFRDDIIFLLLTVYRGKFIEFRHDGGIQVDLGHAGGWLEHERVRICNCVGLPVLDPERVLRRAGHRLAGDHVFSGYRPRATLDPDLPVGVDPAERKVLASDAIDHPLPDVTGPDDIGRQTGQS